MSASSEHPVFGVISPRSHHCQVHRAHQRRSALRRRRHWIGMRSGSWGDMELGGDTHTRSPSLPGTAGRRAPVLGPCRTPSFHFLTHTLSTGVGVIPTASRPRTTQLTDFADPRGAYCSGRALSGRGVTACISAAHLKRPVLGVAECRSASHQPLYHVRPMYLGKYPPRPSQEQPVSVKPGRPRSRLAWEACRERSRWQHRPKGLLIISTKSFEWRPAISTPAGTHPCTPGCSPENKRVAVPSAIIELQQNAYSNLRPMHLRASYSSLPPLHKNPSASGIGGR